MTWERFAADQAKLYAELDSLRTALAKEQREHANCEDVNAQRFQVLTNTIIALTQQVTAMRPIVEAVADIDNSDNSACYVTCELTLYDSENPDEGVHHDTPCIIDQARAFVAAYPQESVNDIH